MITVKQIAIKTMKMTNSEVKHLNVTGILRENVFNSQEHSNNYNCSKNGLDFYYAKYNFFFFLICG